MVVNCDTCDFLEGHGENGRWKGKWFSGAGLNQCSSIHNLGWRRSYCFSGPYLKLKGSLSHILLTIDFLSVVGTWMKSGRASPNNVIFTKLELGYWPWAGPILPFQTWGQWSLVQNLRNLTQLGRSLSWVTWVSLAECFAGLIQFVRLDDQPTRFNWA